MNIGFGTETPYLIVGAPWLSTTFLLDKLRSKSLKGVEFSEVSYRPQGSSYHKRVPKYDGQSCSGIKLDIKKHMLISVLIPCYNEKFTLKNL